MSEHHPRHSDVLGPDYSAHARPIPRGPELEALRKRGPFVPEAAEQRSLALTIKTPRGVESRTLAHAILAVLEEEFGATVETRQEADGEPGVYLVYIDRSRADQGSE